MLSRAAERARSSIARFYDNCKKKVKGKKGYPKFQKNNKKITFTDKKNIGTVKLK